MTDQRATLAAHSNADWYAMMFDIHQIGYVRSDIAFLATASPPRYHSWMTTLDPQAQENLHQLVEQNVQQTGFGIKDAFNSLQLEALGLVELFSASWLFADDIQPASTNNWVQITTASDLLLWEAAWNANGSPSSQRQFPDEILSRKDVVIWGRKVSTGFDAGVIANVSAECVGLSNCFGKDAYPAAATLCAQLADAQENPSAPSKRVPVVGYERGNDLDAAVALGFEATGPLSVWVKKG